MAYVARFSIDLMFGCASLQGTDPEALALPLSYLHHFHPHARRHACAGAAGAVRRHEPDAEGRDRSEGSAARLPPLIKGYVRAGACIGDGAVIDRQFGTTDVFIYLPVAKMDDRSRRFRL